MIEDLFSKNQLCLGQLVNKSQECCDHNRRTTQKREVKSLVSAHHEFLYGRLANQREVQDVL